MGNTMFNSHALQRITERLTPEEARDVIARVASYVDSHRSGSHGIKVLRDATLRGGDGIRNVGGIVRWHDVSNGDIAIVIVRDGHVMSAFWRRANQPINRASLRVDVLACI